MNKCHQWYEIAFSALDYTVWSC